MSLRGVLFYSTFYHFRREVILQVLALHMTLSLIVQISRTCCLLHFNHRCGLLWCHSSWRVLFMALNFYFSVRLAYLPLVINLLLNLTRSASILFQFMLPFFLQNT